MGSYVGEARGFVPSYFNTEWCNIMPVRVFGLQDVDVRPEWLNEDSTQDNRNSKYQSLDDFSQFELIPHGVYVNSDNAHSITKSYYVGITPYYPWEDPILPIKELSTELEARTYLSNLLPQYFNSSREEVMEECGYFKDNDEEPYTTLICYGIEVFSGGVTDEAIDLAVDGLLDDELAKFGISCFFGTGDEAYFGIKPFFEWNKGSINKHILNLKNEEEAKSYLAQAIEPYLTMKKVDILKQCDYINEITWSPAYV